MDRRTFHCTIAGACLANWTLKKPGQQRRVGPTGTQSPAQAAPDAGPVNANARRIALVIGNNQYVRAPQLQNAVNDARDLSATLQRLNFEVTSVTDASLSTVENSVRQFASGLRKGDIALFFYSGHGLQVEGENYLVPVDFDLANGEAGVKSKCFPCSKAQLSMEASVVWMQIVILDACRSNPFSSRAAGTKGMAMPEVDQGTYLALAAGPGQTASDNSSERNGLFTKFLLTELPRPGQSIDQVFGRVKKQVADASRNAQRPWLHADILQEFFFNDAGAPEGQIASRRTLRLRDLLMEGKRQLAAKQFQDAADLFEQATHIDPEDPFTYNALGAAYTKMQQWSLAVATFSKAIELSPGYAAAYFNRGVAYHNAGRYQLAVQDFSWAIDEEASDPLPLDLRGRSYFALLDYEHAKEDFDLALELNPSDSAALLGRGRVYFRQGNFPDAIEDLSLSIRLRPTAEAFLVRSQAYRAIGRMALSDADQQRATRTQH
ncbi:MAG: caspase family protein [Acidobacteriaceae bacterium]|nr:caspase family protein [Acidobacteriaceae bacterium]MBV9779486.1 caspase family protein [Acidobacteriaceae bacterium]